MNIGALPEDTAMNEEIAAEDDGSRDTVAVDVEDIVEDDMESDDWS